MRIFMPARSRSKGRRVVSAATSDVIYDLYGTDTMGRGTPPFTINWPEAPTGPLTPLTVTNNAQLATALATPSAQITVAAGSYNALTLASSNQHWIIDSGATFSGFGGSGFARVIVDGGNVVMSGASTTHNFTDLLIRNLNIQSESWNFGLGSSMFSRLAIIHCTSYSQRTGFFIAGQTAADAGVFANDLIFAANYISGGMDPTNYGVEPAVRIMATRRVMVVDNRARCGLDIGSGGVEDTKHTFRSHHGCSDYWMRRNLTEFGDGIYWKPRTDNDLSAPNSAMGRHWCYDFTIHTTRLSAFALRDAVNPTNWTEPIVVDGNAGYTDVTSNDNWIWAGQAGDTIGTNTINAYQAPPAFGAWLTADGSPPGADH